MKSKLVVCWVVLTCTLLSLLTVAISISAAPLAQSRHLAPATQRVPVRWFVGLGQGSDPSMLAAQQQVVADYNAAQTTISLTLEVVASATAAQTLQNEIHSGNAPDIIGPVGTAGSDPFELLDLTSLITTTGYDLSVFDTAVISNQRTLTGELTGLPLLIWPSYIYYNKDLFDAAGLAYPPHQYGQPYTDTVYSGTWTVDKVAEIAKLMTLDNIGRNSTNPSFDAGHIVQYGYVPQWTDDPRAAATLFGANSIIDINGNAQIPDNWRTGLKWYYNGMWGSQPFIPNDAALNGPLLNSDAFHSGHVAMGHSHLWYLCCLNTTNVPHWDIAATPSYSGTITAKLHDDGFRILKASQHPAEAFEAMKYLVGPADSALADTYAPGYGGLVLPAAIALQTTYVNRMKLQYPNVDWQVVLDSIAYADDPNHEATMPNYQLAQNRISDFGNLYRGTANLNIDDELTQLQSDLQWIFHEHQVFLPLCAKNYCPGAFFDDFTNPNSGWGAWENSDYKFGDLDGEFQIILKNMNSWFWDTPSLVLPSDYVMEVDARHATTNLGNYGLMFGVRYNGNDPVELYQFIVSPDSQEYFLEKYNNGTWTTLINWTYDSGINYGMAANHLSVRRVGTSISVGVNSYWLKTIYDGDFTSAGRDGGLKVFSYAYAPTDMRFDNFLVTCLQ